MVEGGGGRANKTRKSIFKIHLCCLFMAYLLLICPHLSIAALFFRFFPFLFSVVFFFLNLYLYFYFRKWNRNMGRRRAVWFRFRFNFFSSLPPQKNPFENQKNQRWKNSWSRNTLPLPTRDASKISRALLARIINLFFCHASFFAGIQITFFCGFFFSVVHFKPTSLWGEKLAQTFIQRTYVRNEPQFGTKDRSNWNMRPRRVHLHAFAFALVFILIHT